MKFHINPLLPRASECVLLGVTFFFCLDKLVAKLVASLCNYIASIHFSSITLWTGSSIVIRTRLDTIESVSHFNKSFTSNLSTYLPLEFQSILLKDRDVISFSLVASKDTQKKPQISTLSPLTYCSKNLTL